MNFNRRNFIKTNALASVSLLIPRLLSAFQQPLESLAGGRRKLVVLQLTGGNDGLNTVIPVRNDIYYKKRPTLALPQHKALPLTDEVGIHPALKGIKALYDEGYVALVNQVGYPEPDKSHFRSMDIWQSASPAAEIWQTGWLGRYLDQECAVCTHPTGVLEFDDLLSLALKGNEKKGIAVDNPKKLFQNSNQPFFKELAKAENGAHLHTPVSYLYHTLTETLSSAGYIFSASNERPTQATYPNTKIGRDFKTIASLIRSDMDTSVFYLSHGSFDTHVNQLDRQAQLFAQMDDAITAFVSDMKNSGKWNELLLMTFSEFGRRVGQNASGGTDHGTANTMFFLSGSLKRQGLYNALPELTDLVNDDLRYQMDFRNVYATVLHKWLGANDYGILKENFPYLDFI